MSFVAEYGAGSTGSPSTLTVTLTGGASVGESLVASAAVLLGNATMTATDDAGNTWQFIASEDMTYDTSLRVHMLYCNVTTALDPGDTVTFNFGIAATSSAVSVAHFTDYLTPDKRATGDNGGSNSSAPLTAATATTAEANELLYGAFALNNPGRTFTPGSGYTGLTKVLSLESGSNRAIQPEYRYVTSTGSYVADGTLNSGGQWVGMIQTFTLTEGEDPDPEPTGTVKVWDGSAWVERPVKVWTGSAWETKPTKFYDGTQWVTTGA